MLWGHSSTLARTPLTVGDHGALAHDVGAFRGVAASWGNTALLLGGEQAEQVGVGWVTPEYFDVLGIRPAIGRFSRPGEQNAAVVSHDLWVRRYGSDPAVLGRSIELSGESLALVGILSADENPNLSTYGGRRSDDSVWRLQPPDWTRGDDRSVGWLRSTARLRDGVTLAAAQQEVDALMLRVNERVTERDGGLDLRIDLIPVRADLVAGVSRTLWVLLAAVCAVLLIAASNVAHLMLGRAEVRSRDVALRAALGGSRGRLFRQLIVASVVLAGRLPSPRWSSASSQPSGRPVPTWRPSWPSGDPPRIPAANGSARRWSWPRSRRHSRS